MIAPVLTEIIITICLCTQASPTNFDNDLLWGAYNILSFEIVYRNILLNLF